MASSDPNGAMILQLCKWDGLGSDWMTSPTLMMLRSHLGARLAGTAVVLG